MRVLAFNFFLLNLFLFHPVYTGTIHIDYNGDEAVLEVSASFFFNDFEDVFNQGKRSQIISIPSSVSSQSLVQVFDGYFKKNLKVTLDSKNIPLTVIGYEIEGSKVIIYLSSGNQISPFKQAQVVSTVLFDFNKSQINIVRFSSKRTEKSLRTSFGEPSVTFNF